MSRERREVRATLDFFHDLDRQLPSERGPNGEPSSSDFQTFELLEIVEKFATGFDDLPALIQGRDDYRILISTGVVVRAYAVVGQASSDGAVELISLDLDRASTGHRHPRFASACWPLTAQTRQGGWLVGAPDVRGARSPSRSMRRFGVVPDLV